MPDHSLREERRLADLERAVALGEEQLPALDRQAYQRPRLTTGARRPTNPPQERYLSPLDLECLNQEDLELVADGQTPRHQNRNR